MVPGSREVKKTDSVIVLGHKNMSIQLCSTENNFRKLK